MARLCWWSTADCFRITEPFCKLARFFRLTAFPLDKPEVAKALAHLPRLNAGVIAIVIVPALLAASTPMLLLEVAASQPENYRALTAEMLSDTLQMLQRVHPQRGVPRIQSLARLRQMHDEVSVEYLRDEGLRLHSFRLPFPPLKGTPEIVPIRTMEELIEEGDAQDNCVATYAERVQRRSLFIYRVLKPERATLSIVRSPDGDWRIGELETRSNGEVSAMTRHLVDCWLDAYAMSA